METQKPLFKDEDGEEVDVYLYKSMIGSLMYLTSSRPDIMFAVCACARYQYPKDSPFDLVAYTDSDYDGASLDRKSITEEAKYVAASSCYGQVLWIQNQLLDYGMVKNVENVSSKFLMYPRFVQVFLDRQLEGMATHDEIYVTPSHTKKVFGNMKRVGKGFSGNVTPLFPTMMKKHKTRKSKKKNTKTSSPITNVADEADNEENEHTKTTQALKIDSLKRRVKKLEKKQRSRTHGLKRLYKIGLSARVVSSEDEGLGEEDASKQGRKIHDIDADEDITLENVNNDQMFDVSDLAGEEVFVIKQGVPDSKKDDVVSIVVNAAQSSKPKAKGVVFKEQSESTTTTTTRPQQIPSIVQDKGKGKMVEPEPVKKFSKKDQVSLDEELAFKLQAEEEEEERLAREKVEANVALIEEWNDIHAKIKAD
ncbi:hypothetical protein Tco_0439819 [Tanacetum coccineum]